MKKKIVILITDGSSNNNVGAWSAIIIYDNNIKLLFGTLNNTTNSRCELYPILYGLKYINKNIKFCDFVCVISDSEYVIRSLSDEYNKNKNEDLWDQIKCKFPLKFMWMERNSIFLLKICDAVANSLFKNTNDLNDKISKEINELQNKILSDYNLLINSLIQINEEDKDSSCG